MATTVASRARHKKARLTEEEFIRLPSDGRKYELVDGEAKEVPAGHRHDVIGARVIVRLAPYARGRGYLAGSQAGFRMITGNIRSPDVAFTLKERLPEGRPSEGFEDFAPDLAIEIISPNEDKVDLLRKIGEYFASGAKQVWLLFPEMQMVKVYTDPFEMRTLSSEDELEGGDLLPGFRCKVRELFEIE
ncbi:MAG: Uma2 family endonuclease [Fimbriimonadales bacterium]|nr:Uma2 family endonuclease [Fimbriimonadales bacterium]